MKLPRLSSSSFFDVTKAKIACLGTIAVGVLTMAARAWQRGSL